MTRETKPKIALSELTVFFLFMGSIVLVEAIYWVTL